MSNDTKLDLNQLYDNPYLIEGLPEELKMAWRDFLDFLESERLSEPDQFLQQIIDITKCPLKKTYKL